MCWVFVSARGPSLVGASGGHSSSRCAGLSPSRSLPLRSTGSRRAGSAAVAHGPRCSAACGILPDQGPNPRPLHWQADSQPLRHQGSPQNNFIEIHFTYHKNQSLKVYCSMVFSIFTELCKHHHNLRALYHPKVKPSTHYQSPPVSTPSSR